MRSFTLKVDPLTGEEFYEVYSRGNQILTDALLNKGSSFSEEERNALGLQGLLRPACNDLDHQMLRVVENYSRKTTNLERYINLMSLLDRNETLFYRFLTEHLRELLPIVYTPTVGEACLVMSHITRRYRGVYLSPENIQNIDAIFQSLDRPEIGLMVVTDGERILGLGDLGSDGMGISVGKINLYVAAGGIHPMVSLPVCLDVGTNNQRLLEDPLYLGIRKPRLTGKAYDDFIERFVTGVRRNWPNALVQWEDFAKHNAFRVLRNYQDRLLSFNDDIQGTGATACASLLTAREIRGRPLKDERICIAGMGQAGLGTAHSIAAAMREEGLSEGEIRQRIFAIDQPGLLLENSPGLEEPQKPFAQPRDVAAEWTLEQPGRIGLYDVVKNAGITTLIGVTAVKGLFDEKILGQLAKNSERPVVLALSNPTAQSECTPLEVVRATDGRGLIATGSPFDPVEWNGHSYHASQCNNLYMFPGVGLGVLIAKSMKVTYRMFNAASRTLSSLVTPEQRQQGLLLPGMDQVRKVAAKVALAVAIEARESGLGRRMDDQELEKAIARAQWEPHYYEYRAGRAG